MDTGKAGQPTKDNNDLKERPDFEKAAEKHARHIPTVETDPAETEQSLRTKLRESRKRIEELEAEVKRFNDRLS